MSLDLLHLLAVEQEVLSNHLNVAEPVPPVLDGASILGLHYESSRGITNVVLALHSRCYIRHVLLALHPPDYHVLDQLAAGLRVCVNAICTFDLDKSEATIVKFGDIAAKILDEGELSSRVLSFIAVSVKN